MAASTTALGVTVTTTDAVSPRPDSRDATGDPFRLIGIVAAGVAGLAGLVVLLYATSIHVAAGASDKATTILVGQAIGAGHILLHGWTLPPGNYWTTDAAIYAVAIRMFGLRPGLLYSEPALVAAVTIVVGVFIARHGRRGAAGVAGAVAVIVLLAFATPAMALWFVGNGFHLATALYSLVAFVWLRRGGFGWRWAAAVALLTFGMIGDLEIAFFALAPLAFAGVAAMALQRRWQSGVPLVTAAAVAAVIGEVVLKIAHGFGAFQPGPPLPIAGVAQMVRNLGNVFSYVADLVGITNGRFGTGGIPSALLGVHAIGGACVVAGVMLALWNLVMGVVRGSRQAESDVTGTERWRYDDLLLLATVSSAVPFVLLAGPNGVGIHFLSIPVVFACILTGRMVAGTWSRLPAGRTVRAVAVVGFAASLTFAAGLGVMLSRPTPVEPASALASWLEAHNLHNGVGGYWTAAITTVESAGAVTVRPMEINDHGDVRRMSTQSTTDWYGGERYQFFVSEPARSGNQDTQAAIDTWGTPAQTYVVGPYHVLVWGHTLQLAGFSVR